MSRGEEQTGGRTVAYSSKFTSSESPLLANQYQVDILTHYPSPSITLPSFFLWSMYHHLKSLFIYVLSFVFLPRR